MFDFQFIRNLPLSQFELAGADLQKTRRFLEINNLYPDSDADFTVNILDYDGDIVATGSLVGNILKFIAVSESEQGTGACAAIVSELINYAYRAGIFKLFLFTKPKNEALFRSVGFYTLAKTADSCMMENSRQGFDEFIGSLERPNMPNDRIPSPVIGAIVANCNPMTNGHLYLIESASKRCDALHLFILSEDRSEFSASERYDIVKKATEHIPSLYLHKSSQYIISSVTFPKYFLKESADANTINADLDLELFATRIAPELNITIRFVGTEPFCDVTRAYNERMKIILPKHGIEVVEFERIDGISASNIRRLITEKKFNEIKELVPTATFEQIMRDHC